MDNYKNSRLGDFYEYGGAIIIFLVIILFLAYGYKLVFQGRQEPVPVNVVRNHVPNYVNTFQEIKKRGKTDSLLTALLSEKENFIDSIKVLNRNISEVSIGNSDTETKVKIVASIIAIIVAVVGFFGFKSLNDIREHTIKNSQIDAKDVAEKTAKKTMDELRSKTISLEELIKSIEGGLATRLNKLEGQINNVDVIVKDTNSGINEFENDQQVENLQNAIAGDEVKDDSADLVYNIAGNNTEVQDNQNTETEAGVNNEAISRNNPSLGDKENEESKESKKDVDNTNGEKNLFN